MNRRIKINVIFNMILSISSLFFPIITFPYVSRILLPEGMGKVSFASSVIAYFNMFCMLGIPTYGVRECAKVRDDKDKLSKLVQELFFINTILLLITSFIFVVLVLMIPTLNREKHLFFVMSIAIFLNSIGFEWLYKALEQYDYIAIRTLAFKFLGLLLMFVFVHEPKDYIKYGAIVTFSSYGSYLLNAINMRKYITLKKYSRYSIKLHLKPILTFFASSIAVSIYTNLDTIMLGYLCGSYEVGLYNAAIKIKAMLSAILSAPAIVFLPQMTILVANKQFDELKKQAGNVINSVSLVAIPCSIFFILYAPETIVVLSGTEYSGAIPMMRIIMPASFFITLTGILGNQILNSLGKERIIFCSVALAAFIDFSLNFMLIPLMGGIGASITTFLAEIVVFLIQVLALEKAGLNPISIKYLLHLGMGTLLAMIVVELVNYFTVFSSQILKLGIGLVVFFLIYMWFLYVSKDGIFRMIITKIKKIIIEKIK